jgi:hypothetical protein
VTKLSSFDDKVVEAKDVKIKLHVPIKDLKSIMASSADVGATTGQIEFKATPDRDGSTIELTLNRVILSTICTIE